jgi:hypothetical protein
MLQNKISKVISSVYTTKSPYNFNNIQVFLIIKIIVSLLYKYKALTVLQIK